MQARRALLHRLINITFISREGIMVTRRVFVGVICLTLMGSLLLTPQAPVVADPGPGDDQPQTVSQENASSSRKKLDKKDIPGAVAYLQAHEKHNLLPVEGAEPLAVASPGSYVVEPILFIPSDLAEGAGNTAAIDETFQLLRRWYSGALELNSSGYTFQVMNTAVYHASQPFWYYKCIDHASSCDNYDGLWGNIQDELRGAGYPLWSAGTSHLVFVKGAGGWAGSNNNQWYVSKSPAPGPASTGGFGILGDWALDAITGTVNPDCYATPLKSFCYQDPQRGAVGHELGHTFGLAHAMNTNGSIMYSWWDFPFDSLINVPGNDEVSVLRNDSPFFSPQACSPDAQVDQTVMPTTMTAGTRFNISFSVTNYGFCRWASTTTALSSLSGNVWGLSQQPLSRVIYPAQPYTFSLSLKAPLLKRNQGTTSYDCYWQLRIQKRSFGPRMGNTITVTK